MINEYKRKNSSQNKRGKVREEIRLWEGDCEMAHNHKVALLKHLILKSEEGCK